MNNDLAKISSDVELDEWIKFVDSAPDGAERMKRIRAATYTFDYEAVRDLDPFSDAYKAEIVNMYRSVAGAEYDVANEKENFKDEWVQTPFPYLTKSQATISENLIGIATVLRHLPVAPPARLIELGSGWGNMSLILGRSGYHVHAVDVDAKCAALVRHWSEIYGIADRVKTVECEFDKIEAHVDDKFDAAIFFKSFHHSLNHVALLESCRRILKPGGYVVFAAEPIHEKYPAPWALRHDGVSIFMVKKNRWLELGFRDDYFNQLLDKTGFELVRDIRDTKVPTGNLRIARAK